jgi:ubiquinone/menaquinone biosynthesis C-methylase UbiE
MISKWLLCDRIPYNTNLPMNHSDHVRLLQNGISSKGGTWADLGSGAGAFTLALAEVVGPKGEIYSIDKDQDALREQAQAMPRKFPSFNAHYIHADFTRHLDLPMLDGIVMANALHFLPHVAKDKLLKQMLNYLCPGGRLIVVEYNVDRGNIWVPYPMAYTTWESIATRNGFVETRLLATASSHFLEEIYSALSFRSEK